MEEGCHCGDGLFCVIGVGRPHPSATQTPSPSGEGLLSLALLIKTSSVNFVDNFPTIGKAWAIGEPLRIYKIVL
jgi:hypothetical protein